MLAQLQALVDAERTTQDLIQQMIATSAGLQDQLATAQVASVAPIMTAPAGTIKPCFTTFAPTVAAPPTRAPAIFQDVLSNRWYKAIQPFHVTMIITIPPKMTLIYPQINENFPFYAAPTRYNYTGITDCAGDVQWSFTCAGMVFPAPDYPPCGLPDVKHVPLKGVIQSISWAESGSVISDVWPLGPFKFANTAAAATHQFLWVVEFVRLEEVASAAGLTLLRGGA